MREPSFGRKVFLITNSSILLVIGLVMFLPFLNIIAQAFSHSAAIEKGEVLFFPVQFTTANFEVVFGDPSIWRAFGVTVYITVLGTLINLAATATFAYPLSRQEFIGRKYVLLLVLFTMIFYAPLIPNFLLIRELGLMDSLWALMIPGAISTFNFFVMRSFFLQIPTELIDSSRIDGCGEMRILWNLVLPLSKPAMATLSIFYAVTHWNAYQSAIYYINDRRLAPLQVKLREMIIKDEFKIDPNAEAFNSAIMSSPEGIKMAVILVATIPIIMVYPFLQRYFVKGMLLGSVKS